MMHIGSTVPRTYLFVPPEEKAEAEALGALWDSGSKRWYIDSAEPWARYSKWLPDEDHDEEFNITSTESYVAAATTVCPHCGVAIEVICIHCVSGVVFGDPLREFTVSDVRALSDSLARQLRAWPHYRKVLVASTGDAYFANHCSNCGAEQDDLYLHSEPDEPFFDIPAAAPGSIVLTPLAGSIELSGDEHFQVR